MKATVMPHALFLGSSLAGIDRLNMVPRPPTMDDKAKRSFKMPTIGLIKRLRGRSASVEEETIEMEPTCPPLVEGSRPDSTATGQDSESKPDLLPRENTTSKQSDYETAMKKYEADMKSFDRIRWTDLHISHATVGPPPIPSYGV